MEWGTFPPARLMAFQSELTQQQYNLVIDMADPMPLSQQVKRGVLNDSTASQDDVRAMQDETMEMFVAISRQSSFGFSAARADCAPPPWNPPGQWVPPGFFYMGLWNDWHGNGWNDRGSANTDAVSGDEACACDATHTDL